MKTKIVFAGLLATPILVAGFVLAASTNTISVIPNPGSDTKIIRVEFHDNGTGGSTSQALDVNGFIEQVNVYPHNDSTTMPNAGHDVYVYHGSSTSNVFGTALENAPILSTQILSHPNTSTTFTAPYETRVTVAHLNSSIDGAGTVVDLVVSPTR